MALERDYLDVQNAKDIENGDQLRNINSYEYLKEIAAAIPPETMGIPAIDQLKEIFEKHPTYDPTFPYGDLYTKFILDLEKEAPRIQIEAREAFSRAQRLRGQEEAFKAIQGQYYANLEKFEKYLEDKKLLDAFRGNPHPKEFLAAHKDTLNIPNEFISASEFQFLINNHSNIRDIYNPLLGVPKDRLNQDQRTDNSGGQAKLGNTFAAQLTPLENRYRALDRIMSLVYANPNKGLERAGNMVGDITKSKEQNTEHTITQRLKGFTAYKQVNKTTPQYEGSGFARFKATISPEFKPQSTTSMASIRDYAYKKKDPQGKSLYPTEYRFGTQGQFFGKWKPRVNPTFEAWLESEKRSHPFDEKKPITHVYFNNLALDRTDFEGKREAKLSRQLHDLEYSHSNIAVITLPADKGLMDKHFLESHKKQFTYQYGFDKLLAIADGNSQDRIQDFFISDNVKKLLYGKDEYGGYDFGGYDKGNEHEKLHELLQKSFEAMGFKAGDNLSPAELQAVYFHFTKFELTDFILKTLDPKSYNMSCKDAIDRGGVSSAYYNLLKSLKTNEPFSDEEFFRALQAAPTLVKGRGMNHHIKLIWNALQQYQKGPNDPPLPEAVQKWVIDHSPKSTKQHFINQINEFLDTKPIPNGAMFARPITPEEISAAKKMLDALSNNTNVVFEPNELSAINKGRLGKIYEQIQKTGAMERQHFIGLLEDYKKTKGSSADPVNDPKTTAAVKLLSNLQDPKQKIEFTPKEHKAMSGGKLGSLLKKIKQKGVMDPLVMKTKLEKYIQDRGAKKQERFANLGIDKTTKLSAAHKLQKLLENPNAGDIQFSKEEYKALHQGNLGKIRAQIEEKGLVYVDRYASKDVPKLKSSTIEPLLEKRFSPRSIKV